jgi:SAM-dependent methyltransferase
MASFYSNSKMDIDHSRSARGADEDAVRGMYEDAPYPDLGSDLKDLGLYLNPIRADLSKRDEIKFLDVGCGTGHVLVGVAKSHPEWDCYGIDLSKASLDVATELSKMHGAKVEIERGSYLDPLPFDHQFDVISAMGTIHHCADPLAAMRNLKKHLKEDGYLLLHLYGLRCDREKFDIKEALSILEPNLRAHQTRFDFYSGLMGHTRRRWVKRLALTMPGDAIGAVRAAWRNFRRRRRNVSWSPSFRERYDEVSAPWIDHFCHPCERAYEVPQVQELVETSGFKVVRMLAQGRENKKLIPREWAERYDELDDWEKWRLSELLAVGGGSFAMILQKAD